MQNMFKNKGVKTIEKPYVVEPKVANPSVHIVDVNMAIARSKVTKDKCSRTESQLKENMLLIWKRSKDYNNVLLRLY